MRSQREIPAKVSSSIHRREAKDDLKSTQQLDAVIDALSEGTDSRPGERSAERAD